MPRDSYPTLPQSVSRYEFLLQLGHTGSFSEVWEISLRDPPINSKARAGQGCQELEVIECQIWIIANSVARDICLQNNKASLRRDHRGHQRWGSGNPADLYHRTSQYCPSLFWLGGDVEGRSLTQSFYRHGALWLQLWGPSKQRARIRGFLEWLVLWLSIRGSKNQIANFGRHHIHSWDERDP